jgi:transaldolase
MKREALKIHRWQDNVYVKIPVTNSRGESSLALVRELS